MITTPLMATLMDPPVLDGLVGAAAAAVVVDSFVFLSIRSSSVSFAASRQQPSWAS